MGRHRAVRPGIAVPAFGAPAFVVLAVVALALAGCTSDPNAAINQTPPIRQMDHFFNSLSGPPTPDYKHQPGYAPAYPAY